MLEVLKKIFSEVKYWLVVDLDYTNRICVWKIPFSTTWCVLRFNDLYDVYGDMAKYTLLYNSNDKRDIELFLLKKYNINVTL